MGFFSGGVCTSVVKLTGRSVIITGGNAGIGKETAIDLARRGAHVTIACRNPERGELALKEIKERSGSDLVSLKMLDLSSFSSIREFAEQINSDESSRIHTLINNAGVMMMPYQKTADGNEMQFGTNHLGHFLLTNLLLDKIKSSAPSRIINVSSAAHNRGTIKLDDINSEKSYNKQGAYGQSKLANVLFTSKLHRMLSEENVDVSVFSLHPGVIVTELWSSIQKDHPWLFAVGTRMFQFAMKTPEEGAQTQIYCAVEPGLEKDSGKYFSDCALKEPSREAQDGEVADKLWDLSLQLCGL